MKIVSLLPSATEIICSLDLCDHLVGVTHECDYPPWVTRLPRVTQSLIPHDISSREIDNRVREQLNSEKALYSLKREVLKSLQPDLIVTQALCDVCAVAEEEVLSAAHDLSGNAEVINLEPVSLNDVLDCLRLVGEATDRTQLAAAVTNRLQERIDTVIERTQQKILAEVRPGVAFLEWLDPLFNAGHWTPELIEHAGGVDRLGNRNEPSTTLSWSAVRQSNPDILFIACCGYDLERTLADIPLLGSNPGWDSLACVKNRRVYATDGSAYFSRPGPRLVDSLEIMAHAIYPDIHTLPEGIPPAVNTTHLLGNPWAGD